MGLLDLIEKKGLEISLKTVMKVRTFPTSLVARLVARMWMSLRLCTRRQSMPVCVFLLKRWRHFLFTSMNGQKMGRRKSWTTHCTFFFMMNPIQRCPPLSFERQS